MTDPLASFFAPRTIAVVGASDDPTKWGHILAKQALRNPDRRAFLVNSRAATVLGQPAWPSLRELPEAVELAVVSVPVGGFERVIDDVIASGTKAVLAITAGFAELGAEGEALQRRCTERLRMTGVRMIGPNCLGLSDNTNGVFLAANDFAAGDIALLSQSGNLALELDVQFRNVGLGFSRFVSIGNQADVDLVELIDSCVADAGTSAIALYVEDFLDGRAFIRAAQRAHKAGKPVVVLASGSTPAALRSAGSHTGALSTAEDVVRHACRTAGAHFVRTPRELVTALRLLHRGHPRACGSVGIVTDGGGHGTIAAGLLEAAGFRVPQPSAQLQERLRAALWPPSSVVNPVDLAGFGEQEPSSYAAAVELLLQEVDAVMVTGYFGGYSSPQPFAEGLADGEVAAATRIVEIARAAGKPVVVHSMAQDSNALRVCAAGGVAAFDAIEDAVFALTTTLSSSGSELPDLPSPRPPAHSAYWQLREYLRSNGVPSGRVIPVSCEADLDSAVRQLTAPFVVKTAASTHKSDNGGVRLALADLQAAKSAYAQIVSDTGHAEASIESMVTTRGVELLVGLHWDPRFGPILSVAAGGTMTEIMQDVAIEFAPVSVDTARRMVQSLRIAPLLHGFRGRPPLAVERAAAVIATLSEIASAQADWREFEVNPLLVTEDDVHVLDARALS